MMESFHSALRHRRLRGAAAAVRRRRLHRRPLPGRRDAAVRQPDERRPPRRPLLPATSATTATSAPRTSRPTASGCSTTSTTGSTTTCAGSAPAPRTGVTATTQTCPRDGAVGGPVPRRRPSPASRTARSASPPPEPQTISTGRRSRRPGRAIDPVGGGGDGCVQTASADAPGTATYRLPAGDRRRLHAAGRAADHGRSSTVSGAAAGGRPGGRPPLGRRRRQPDGWSRAGRCGPRAAPTDSWELHPNGWRFAARPRRQARAADLRRPLRAAPRTAPSRSSVSDLELRAADASRDRAAARAQHGGRRHAPRCKAKRRGRKKRRRKKRRRRPRAAERTGASRRPD